MCFKNFRPKQGQGFKSSVAHLYPNIGQVPPPGHSTILTGDYRLRNNKKDQKMMSWISVVFDVFGSTYKWYSKIQKAKRKMIHRVLWIIMVNHKPPSYVQSHLKRLNWARSHIMLIIWDLSHVIENPFWALLHPVSDFVTSVSCDAKMQNNSRNASSRMQRSIYTYQSEHVCF